MKTNRITGTQRKGGRAYLLSALLLLALALVLGALAVAGFLSLVGVITLFAVLLVGASVLAVVYGIRRRRMRLMLLALRDTARATDMKRALGEDGVRQLLPYFQQQMSGGTTAARLLILDLVRGIEFDGKDALVRTAYDSGPLEVRLAIIDQIFDWNLPYELLVDVMEDCDAQLSEYLVRKIFLYSADIADHGLLDRVCARADHLRGTCAERGNTADGGICVRPQAGGGTRPSSAISCNPTARKTGCLPPASWRRISEGRTASTGCILRKSCKKPCSTPPRAEEMIELCAEYDADKAYLKQYLSGYYSDSFLKKVVEYYDPAGIVRSFGESACPVPMALTLLAACRLERGTLGAYRAKRDRLRAYLVLLDGEEGKILATQSRAGKLLLDEIARLRRSLSAALVEFERVDETDFSAPAFTTACSREDTAREDSVKCDFDYRVLRVSESNTLLESIYRYVGGEPMETKLTENIEKLIALKAIPMFSELDVFYAATDSKDCDLPKNTRERDGHHRRRGGREPVRRHQRQGGRV